VTEMDEKTGKPTKVRVSKEVRARVRACVRLGRLSWCGANAGLRGAQEYFDQLTADTIQKVEAAGLRTDLWCAARSALHCFEYQCPPRAAGRPRAVVTTRVLCAGTPCRRTRSTAALAPPVRPSQRAAPPKRDRARPSLQRTVSARRRRVWATKSSSVRACVRASVHVCVCACVSVHVL
jgi:hypothetical protein